jgi:hypothetical protein
MGENNWASGGLTGPSASASAASGAAGGAAAGAMGGPVTAIAGGLFGMMGGLAQGGGSSSQSGYTLPPEYEISLLQHFQDNLASLQKDFTSLTALKENYNTKLTVLNGMIDGTIPSVDAMKALTSSNMSIAQMLGGDAQALVKSGFLTADDAASINQLKELEAATYEDPALKQQLSDQRSRLDQDLRRQGSSPAERAQALAQFDRDAQSQSFKRSQELKTSQAGLISNRIGIGANLRQQGFGQVVGSLQAGQGQIASGQAGINMSSGLNQAGLQGNLALGQQQQSLEQQNISQYQELGKFLLSDRTKALLGQGGIGPGSVATQMGVNAGNVAFSPTQAGAAQNFTQLDDSALMAYGINQRMGGAGAAGKSQFVGGASENAWVQELARRNLTPTGYTAESWKNYTDNQRTTPNAWLTTRG